MALRAQEYLFFGKDKGLFLVLPSQVFLNPAPEAYC